MTHHTLDRNVSTPRGTTPHATVTPSPNQGRSLMIRTKLTSITLAVAAAAALAGCDSSAQGSPTPTPSNTPPTSSTPSATPTPSVDLEAQATAAYKKAFTTAESWAKVGGLAPGNKVPAELEETLTDEALKDQISELQQVYKLGLQRQSGESKITKIRVSSKKRVGSKIALDSCEDGSSIVNKRLDGTTSHGRLIYKTSYYTLVDGRVKMTYYYGEEVKTCPIA